MEKEGERRAPSFNPMGSLKRAGSHSASVD